MTPDLQAKVDEIRTKLQSGSPLTPDTYLTTADVATLFEAIDAAIAAKEQMEKRDGN